MRKQLFFLIFALCIFSCTNKTSCKNVACTALFAMVTVEVSDTSNSNLAGVSTQTILLPSGTTLHTQAEASGFPAGSFTVADDTDLKTLGYNSNHKVEFRIIKDGKVLAAVPYTIATDCCHVSKAEGPEQVSLN